MPGQLGEDLLLVYNDRPPGNSRIDRSDSVTAAEPAALDDWLATSGASTTESTWPSCWADPLLFRPCATPVAGSNSTARANRC